MKIIIYGINYYPELTGIGKYTGEMAEYIASKGHDVRVITAPPYYPEWKVQSEYSALKFSKKNINGVEVYRCPLFVPKNPNTILRILHLISFSLSSFIVLMTKIFTKPNVLIVVAPSFLCAPAGIFFSKISGARSVIHFQDFELDAMFGLGMMKKKGFIARLVFSFESFIVKKFDIVTTISRKMIKNLEKKGIPSKKITFFPNWVDTNFINPEIANLKNKKKFFNDSSSKIILYSGNIGNKQGLEIIVDVAYLMKSYEKIKFIICGSGSNKLDLINYAAQKKIQNMEFIDLVPYDDLPSLINSADVHLVIQKKGSADAFLPSKITTILSSGGYVIVTAEKDTELGILNKQYPGIIKLVPPENENSIKKAIIELIDLPENGTNLPARKYAENFLQKDKIIDDFIEQFSILKKTNTV